MGIFGQKKHALAGRARLQVWLAPLALVVALAAVPTDRASAQGAVKSVHKDWQIRCDTPPGAKSEQCALIQSVTTRISRLLASAVLSTITVRPTLARSS